MIADKSKRIDKEPGIYTDISFEEYRRINAMNHSTLKKFMKQSPFHFKYKWDNGLLWDDTKALSDGRVIHEAVLEPDKFKEKYVLEPTDWREYEEFLTDAEKKYCKKKEKEAGKEGEGGMYFINANANAYGTIMKLYKNQLGEDKQSISQELLYTCKQIRKNLKDNSACQKLFKDARFEVTLVWVDEETGIKCKGRLDVDSEMKGYACDLKKTKSAHPYSFARDVRSYNYNSAAAFYMDGAIQLGHDAFKAFIWLACEDYDPFYVQPFYVRFDDEWITSGRKWYRKALEKMNYCRTTGEWHGYHDKENDSFDMFELPSMSY